jgi:hypothetical protein
VTESPFAARALVDEGILARERGDSWRTGGTFDPG